MASWKYLKTATLGTVTLGSSYTSGGGSMVLTAGQGARLPSTGDFWLAWSEDRTNPDAVIHLWKVTARSTDTLTVTAEASEGGGDTNVSAGEVLTIAISLSAIDQFRQDICQTGAYASAAIEKAGNLYLPNNGTSLLRDSGSAMIPWGPIYPLTTPDIVSNWTQVNPGAASFTSTYGGIRIYAPPVSGANLRILEKTAPATPWTMTVLVETLMFSVDFPGVCIGFRQNSDGKLMFFGLQNAAVSYTNFRRFMVRQYANATTTGTILKEVEAPTTNRYWLQITDNGTNRLYNYSLNGQDWTEFYSEGRTTFLTADRYILAAQSINTTYGAEALFHSVKIS